MSFIWHTLWKYRKVKWSRDARQSGPNAHLADDVEHTYIHTVTLFLLSLLIVFVSTLCCFQSWGSATSRKWIGKVEQICMHVDQGSWEETDAEKKNAAQESFNVTDSVYLSEETF